MQFQGIQGENKENGVQKAATGLATGLELTPVIFNYLNYREFLTAFYEFKKKTVRRYSYGVFSLRAGLKSPNYLKLVMSGARNITPNNILNFAKALGLNDLETVYWENLVAFNQAKNEQQRRHYLVKLAHSPLPDGAAALPIREIKDEWDYYSSWHNVAIREMVLFADFREDPVYIASALKNRISPPQAAQSLDLLKRMRFLVPGPNGRLVQAQRKVRYFSENDVRNIVIQRFHRSTAELAIDSLERDTVSDRDFSGLTLGVSQADLPKLKAKVSEFRKTLNEEFSRTEQANLVLQINFQVIPVTENKV
jgi:uncharacterized protein (TIGR02147 family)